MATPLPRTQQRPSEDWPPGLGRVWTPAAPGLRLRVVGEIWGPSQGLRWRPCTSGYGDTVLHHGYGQHHAGTPAAGTGWPSRLLLAGC